MDKMKILVVGDIMIDRYEYVSTNRNAPEAAIPVWDHISHENRLGGAANVAHNLKALGGDEVDVFLAGIVEVEAKKMISKIGIDTILCAGFDTMYKNRYVDKSTMKIVFRSDNIKEFRRQSLETFELSLRHFLEGHQFDAVIFSDYNKGTISKFVVDIVSPCTKTRIVDSKRLDLSMYKGSQLLKINEHEYAAQVARGPYTNVESLFEFVVVTHGSKGAELRQQEIVKSGTERYMVHSENFPVESVKVNDVTGCGDTHTAAMTFSLLKNNDMRLAVRFANACSRNVVQKFGTSVNDVNFVKDGV